MSATKRDAVIRQIDGLLERVGVEPGESPKWEHFSNHTDAWIAGSCASLGAAIERLTPSGSHYRALRDRLVDRYTDPFNSEVLASYVGILNSIAEDVEAGYLVSVEELIHADVFADFLGMATELHDKGYESAAAVIGGTVLEEHLRKLAMKHGVPTEDQNARPRKAELLNADLVKAAAYNKLVQKQVSAWYAVRNEAAHGNRDAYTSEQVQQLIEGVRDFLVAHPA